MKILCSYCRKPDDLAFVIAVCSFCLAAANCRNWQRLWARARRLSAKVCGKPMKKKRSARSPRRRRWPRLRMKNCLRKPGAGPVSG